MTKFFKNIKVNIIEEVSNEEVIDMMSRYPDVYEEVEDPSKVKKAEKNKAKNNKEAEAEAEAKK